MERKQLDAASTLRVTVTPPDEFSETVTEQIQALQTGDDIDSTPTLSFESYDQLLETLTPRVLELIEAIQHHQPSSINETARVVDRDVSNVHEELTRLAQLGVIYFEQAGNAKQPVVWFDELVISLPFPHEDEGSENASAAA